MKVKELTQELKHWWRRPHIITILELRKGYFCGTGIFVCTFNRLGSSYGLLVICRVYESRWVFDLLYLSAPIGYIHRKIIRKRRMTDGDKLI